MGDRRFDRLYRAVADARDREAALRQLDDEDVIAALAAASREHDALLANVLATSAMNRVRRLRAALIHLGEGVVALGARGEVQWSNPAADRILGWDPASAIGIPFEDIVRHYDASGAPVPADRCRLLATVLSGVISHADGDHFESRGGSKVCVEYTCAPIFSPEGEPAGAVIAFRDCSERRKVERAVRESRERYKSLFDNLPQAILSVSLDGEIIDANAAAEDLTARPIAEARGRMFTDFLHPDDVESTTTLFGRVLEGSHERTRLRIRHKAGHYLDVDAIGVPVVVDGDVVGIHGIVRPREATARLPDGESAGP